MHFYQDHRVCPAPALFCQEDLKLLVTLLVVVVEVVVLAGEGDGGGIMKQNLIYLKPHYQRVS